MPKALRVSQAAAILRIGPDAMRRICERGEVKAARVGPGKYWYIDPKSLYEYAAKHN